jgi:hypothetical protein
MRESLHTYSYLVTCNLLLPILQLLKPEFLLYLDSEIEGQESNSATENMLVTVKLRLLDEIGRGYVMDSSSCILCALL